MRLISLIFLVIVSLTIPCLAQSERETMDIAKREVLRRGSHVVATGTVRSGLVEQALAPPADDSDKWHLTLIGDAADKNFQAMKTMLSETKEQTLLAWIDVKDQARSKMWYHERIWDLKGTQKDWLLPLADQVKEHGLPLIIIQPCRNGHFGDPTTIVKRIHGVVTDKELAEKIREAVFAYVQSIERPITSGVSQTDIGVPPPFNVNPQNAPPVPKPEERRQTFEFPDLKPAVLTLDQIRDACPGATPEFLLEVITSKESNVETAKLRWMVSQLKTERSKPVDLRPVPDEAEVVPARPGAKDFDKSFSVPSISSPEMTAMKAIGVFLVGMLVMKLLTIQWGTLIGGIGSKKNERDGDYTTTRELMRPHPFPPRYVNPTDNPEFFRTVTPHEPTESTGATSESTSTRWRPSKEKSSEPSE